MNKQENLKKKYGITDEELKRAIDQIKLGNIACSGAVLCAICELLANGDIKGNAQQSKIIFANVEHEQFYKEQLAKVRTNDCYHRALIYTIGITEDTRKHFNEIFNIKTDCINADCIHTGWVTGTDVRAIRLAYNLYTGFTPDNDDILKYSVSQIFEYGCIEYFLQAVSLRFE